jgi:nucleoside-diphosphate-sugar epimerase
MSERPAPALASTALIVGCGYLGTRVASRLLERGVTVMGTTRSEQRGHELAELGIQPLLVSVTEPLTFAALKPAIQAPSLDVYYMVPPGRPGNQPSPRQVVLGGTAHMAKQLKHARLGRALLVSSTAVYGQQHGETVDADTPPEPIDDRGKLLHEAEQFWLDRGQAYHVLRLAGLYGPGRVVGLRAVSDGSPIVGDPQKLLNLIHVDDAADLTIAMMQAEAPGRVELGCDGHPVPRMDYYTFLAEQLGVPAPKAMDNEQAAREFGLSSDRLKRSSNKALDNIKTCQRTGWRPRHANYREGVRTVLEQAAKQHGRG